MKKILIILFMLFSIEAPFAYASNLSIQNAGFAPANIWYSKDPFYAGDNVRIYTIIYNGSTYDITGDVEFSDNNTVIGKTNFSLAGDGRTQDVWINWQASQGNHTITAQLINIVADGPNGKQTVVLNNSQTGTNNRVIQIDPTIAAAATKAQMQQVTEAGNQALGTIQGAVGTVSDSLPLPIKTGVSEGANALEQFRIGEAYQFQTAKEEQINKIELSKLATATSSVPSKKTADVVDSVVNATQEPFAYVMLAVYTILQYVFQLPVLFYGLILYALYRLIKWIAGKIRAKNDDV